MPAERLAEFAPAFKRKSRIQEGADTDLLIFNLKNLKNLKDHATYTKPYQEPTSWDYFIFGGQPVVAAGEFTAAKPGQHIINKLK